MGASEVHYKAPISAPSMDPRVIYSPVNAAESYGWAYLQLLGLEHVRPRGREHVVGQLRLAVDIDRCGGLAGQKAVVDLAGPLGQLRESKTRRNYMLCFL